jgi:diaminohydroxyphosphoribosylaminopyrimidine deaminase/5-amino-6-(5-phosphoribosylamino)uracil reductase
VMRVPSRNGRLDLGAVLKLLAGRGITRLMIETGPILAAAFLRADLVDEAVLFQAPQAIGPHGIDALDDLPLAALSHSPTFRSTGREMVGLDRVETFERA